VIPWFGWLFALPVRNTLRHRPADQSVPWWSPPDRLEPRHAAILGLLAAASMSAAFTNTLFTQTASFAADGFSIDERAQAVGGVIVRLGVVIAIPFAMLADRRGRRQIIIVTAWVSPLWCALGAIAPNFWVLVATQTVARPVGLALALLIGVVASEEMPRSSRAYALSVLALAGGLGAGVAVIALRLADIGQNGWRLIYLLSLVWLLPAYSLTRQLPETHRFQQRHKIAPPLDRSRFVIISVVAIAANLFVAPASFFQNRYLDDVRGYTGGGIALFTLCTATPASRVDRRRAGRRNGRAPRRVGHLHAVVDTVDRRHVHVWRGDDVVARTARWPVGGRRLPRVHRLPHGALPHRQSRAGQRVHHCAVARR